MQVRLVRTPCRSGTAPHCLIRQGRRRGAEAHALLFSFVAVYCPHMATSVRQIVEQLRHTAVDLRASGGRKKLKDEFIKDADEPESQLRKELGTWELVVFGLSVLIGAGIYSFAAPTAGMVTGFPFALAFCIAALACAIVAHCYAKLAPAIPVAGSAYTYLYAAFGEFFGWIVGWALVLEFSVGAAVVSRSWSEYLTTMFDQFGIGLPTYVSVGSITIDWGALLLIVTLTLVLRVGVKVCSRISIVLTTFKVLVLLVAVTAGIGFLNPENYVTYVREGESAQSDGRSVLLAALSWFDIHPGGAFDIVFSVFAAASLLVFAFIGFDVVATASEETRDPDRSLPRAIRRSLAIAIILYLVVAVVLIGVVDYNELERAISAGEQVTLATVFESAGATWVAILIAVGALAGLTTVVMLLMLGQTRVLFAISRDGLLPRPLGRVGIRGIPQDATLVVGAVVCLFSMLGDVMPLGELVILGALSVYAAVAWTVHWSLWNQPDFLDHFQKPDTDRRQDGHGLNRRLSVRHFVPLLGTLLCFFLMLNLKGGTWLLFLGWLVIGIAVYCCYGRKNSRLAQKR